MAAQNSGVVISKSNDSVVFEAFELSPPNATVQSTQRRLRRYFPGTAAQVPSKVFNIDHFQQEIAHTIAKMSGEPLKDMNSNLKGGAEDKVDRRTPKTLSSSQDYSVRFYVPLERLLSSQASTNTHARRCWAMTERATRGEDLQSGCCFV